MNKANQHGSILYYLVKKYGKITVEQSPIANKEFSYIINGTVAIVVKYNTNFEAKNSAFFAITENQIIALKALEKNYPLKTYLVLLAGDDLSCSLNMVQIRSLIDVDDPKKRTISMGKIANKGLSVTGSIGSLLKNLELKDYLKLF